MIDRKQIPQDLRDAPIWIVWKYQKRGNDKPTKVPYCTDGTPAKADDPETWSSLDAAMQAMKTGKYAGLGTEFDDTAGMVGIDLDDCLSGANLKSWAVPIVKAFTGTYAEISPSGTGIKFWAKGRLPIDGDRTGGRRFVDKEGLPVRKKEQSAGAVEMYHSRRYFAFTGNRWGNGSPVIIDKQAEINALYRRVFGAEKPVNSALDRCIKYLEKMDPAISGESGHDRAFAAACTCFKFGLNDGEAQRAFETFNARCSPPWNQREIDHKLESAKAAVMREGQFGAMLRDDRNGSAPAALPGKSRPAGEQEPTQSLARPELICIKHVQRRPIVWLWPNRLAFGKVALVAGDPGLGKSFLTLDIAARVSRGIGWPDNPHAKNEPGNIILLSAEDDVEDTIAPRLDAAGADDSRIFYFPFVNCTQPDSGEVIRRQFSLADIDVLREAVDMIDGCRLVIVDPLSAYVGKTDSHNNAEVRAMLVPLAQLAAEKGIAILGITHLRKGDGNAIHRAMGSLAFTAAARTYYTVSRDPADPTGRRRLFLPGKSNIGPDETGLAYELADSGNGVYQIQWAAEPVSTRADEAVNAGSPNKPGPDPEERQRAMDWLRHTLEQGPRLVAELEEEAREGEAISKATLRRAQQELGIKPYREKIPGPWYWRL